MYPSIFHAVEENKDFTAQQLRELLEEMKPGLFSTLDDEGDFRDDEFKLIVQYIVYAYSEKSPMVILGANSMGEKISIFNKLDIASSLRDALILLKDKAVRDTISAYLDYQGDRDFSHLMRKKDLYDKLFEAQMDNVQGADDKVDFKGTIEASKQMDKMMDDIRDLEDKISERYAFIFENFKELESKGPTRKSSLGLEDSGHLRH